MMMFGLNARMSSTVSRARSSGARQPVGQEDVRGGKQAAEELAAGVGLDVDRDAALAAVTDFEHEVDVGPRVLAGETADDQGPTGVAGLDVFHLDHVGAPVRQRCAGGRHVGPGRQLDDPHSTQNSGHDNPFGRMFTGLPPRPRRLPRGTCPVPPRNALQPKQAPQIQVGVVLPGEADPAEDLDRGVADRGQASGECLGAQRRQVTFRRLGRVGRPQRVDDAAAREFDRLVHVDAQVLYRLEATDRLVELPSHLGVFDGEVHHRRGRAECVGGVAIITSSTSAAIASGEAEASRRAGTPSKRRRTVPCRVHMRARRHVHAVRCGVDGEKPGARTSPRRAPAARSPRPRRAGRDLTTEAAPSPGRRRGAAQRTDGGDCRPVGDSGQQCGGPRRRPCASVPASRRPRSTTTARD